MLRKGWLLLIAGLMFALAGCSALAEATDTPPAAVSHGQEIGGYVALVDALRAAGATVTPAGEVEQDFFSVPGQVIEVTGTEVQVFEYADEAAREAEAADISPDGSSIGTSMVTWVDQPNFWARGRVIVLYVGQDADSISLIGSVLGEPITSHTG